VEDNFEFDAVEPDSGYSAPSSDESQSKRQAGFYGGGKPAVYTNTIGTPDIWNMFSQEWGGRVSRRRGRLSRRRGRY